MKKTVVVLLVMLLESVTGFAKKVDGYYITGKKDTVKTQFDIPWVITGEPDFEKIQWEIKYIDDKGDKQTLNPEWTTEVGFSFKDKSYRMLAKRNNLLLTGSKDNKTNILYLRVLVDGQFLQLFQFYVVSTSPGNSSSVYNSETVGSSNTSDKYVLIKKNGKQIRPKLYSFNKEVADFLTDVPELAKKVETKVLNIKDVEQIAKEYNSLVGKPIELAKPVADTTKTK